MFYVIYERTIFKDMSESDVLDKLHILGCKDVKYICGNWLPSAGSATLLLPHFLFGTNEDACIYTLAFNGKVLTEKPYLHPFNNYI